MATLPDIQAIKPVGMQGQAPIAREESVGAEAQSLERTGGVMAQVQEEFYQKRVRQEVASAGADFMIAQTEKEFELEQDSDYETYGERYDSAMAETLGKSAEKIRDPAARALFQEDMSVRVAAGRARVGGMAWNKEKSAKRAKLDEDIDVLTRSIAAGHLDQVPGAIDLVDSHLELGVLTAEEATNLKQEFKSKGTSLYVQAMTTGREQREALENPVVIANLAAPERTRLIEKAQRRESTERGIELGDDIIENLGDVDHEGTMLLALEGLKNEEDPVVRATAEAQVRQWYDNRRTYHAAQDTNDLNLWYRKIVEGEVTTAQMGADFEELSANVQRQLYAAEAARASGQVRRYSDRETVAGLQLWRARQEPQKLAEFFAEHSDKLTPDDHETWSAEILKIENPARGLLDVDNLVTGELKFRHGISDPGADMVIKAWIDRWWLKYSDENGRTPSDGEIREHLDTLLKTHDPGFWSAEKVVGLYTAEELDDQVRTYYRDHPNAALKVGQTTNPLTHRHEFLLEMQKELGE